MAQRLTDRLVRALEAPVTGNRIEYDSEVKGFGCRVTAAGARAFVLNYRFGARERRFTVGNWPAWTVPMARAEAARLKREVDQGRDPLAERQAERTAPTVAYLAERYAAEHLPGKRPRSAAEDRALIRDYLLPALGWLKVAEVVVADVAKLHRAITAAGKSVRANRMLACARTMFGLAVAWGMRVDNPARGGRGGIAMNPEDHRQRFLSPAEIARLAEALDRHPEQTTVALIRFLMLTGCRFGEAARMTWDQVDLTRGVWVKPSSHVKQKRQHVVPLSAPALALLASLERESDQPLVFVSPKTGRALVTVKTAWRTIRRNAGLEAVRLHDLRHSFASVLASSGASLQLIGSLLGHVTIGTTARYAHLSDDARRDAVERVGAAVAGGRSAGEVVDLGTGRRKL